MTRITSSNWSEHLKRAGRSRKAPPASLLCLDPGETTGWALFRNGRLTGSGQFKVTDLKLFEQLITKFDPTLIICENYRVYPWLLKQHSWSEIPTVRYIGIIQYIADVRGTPVRMQMAQMAKVYCTNNKLKRWGLLQVDKKHANDAIRHGCYYLLFAPQ